MEHSLKGYADDVTLISCDIDVHKSVLQTIDLKAADLDLTFKPSKCISFLFDGSKVAPRSLPLSKGTTRPITEGQTKFLGKLIDVSLSAQISYSKVVLYIRDHGGLGFPGQKYHPKTSFQ